MFDDKTDYACVFDLIKTIIDKLLQQRFENAEIDFDFMHGFSGTIYLLAEILRNDNKIFIAFFDDFDYISRKYCASSTHKSNFHSSFPFFFS